LGFLKRLEDFLSLEAEFDESLPFFLSSFPESDSEESPDSSYWEQDQTLQSEIFRCYLLSHPAIMKFLLIVTIVIFIKFLQLLFQLFARFTQDLTLSFVFIIREISTTPRTEMISL
jgi:hypothetical protein